MPDFARNKVLLEAQRQLDSASMAGYRVEWLVSDESAVNQLRNMFNKNNINITITYYPEQEIGCMKIIKEDARDLLEQTQSIIKKNFEDSELNMLLNYWLLFEEREDDILTITGQSLEDILYSKYYWCSKFKTRFTILHGTDVGIEQQQYKIIEEIEQRIDFGVDWDIIQMIENNEL